MTPTVTDAVAELERAYPAHRVRAQPDGQGGAFVVVDDLPLGARWATAETWIGFHVTFAYPRAHVYPHYARPDLARADGAAIAAPLHPGYTMPGVNLPAVMVSRASNRWDPASDTAAHKLARVLHWLQEDA